MIQETWNPSLIKSVVSFENINKEMDVPTTSNWIPYVDSNNRWFICIDKVGTIQGHIRVQGISPTLVLIHGGLFKRQRGQEENKEFIQDLVTVLRKEIPNLTILGITAKVPAMKLLKKAGFKKLAKQGDQFIMGAQ